ncbi:uncharacterized LOC729966 homolog isoform X3 [Gallus gallus]|uniref:uncharacterized LOC729966 homolog isoform X3 n=1 Tax=Gallus gallus TaxID=9031 RepID=UPI001AE1AD73|nr:uncharacterized LOC729966 homolog isoform X3 [Gallus gallus]
MARLLLCCAALLAAGTVHGEGSTPSQPRPGSSEAVTTWAHSTSSRSSGTAEPQTSSWDTTRGRESSAAPLSPPHTSATPSSTATPNAATAEPPSGPAGTPPLPTASSSAPLTTAPSSTPPTSAPSNLTTVPNHTWSSAQPSSKPNPGVVVVVCLFVAVLVGAVAMLLVRLRCCGKPRFQRLDEVPMGKVSEESHFARHPPR